MCIHGGVTSGTGQILVLPIGNVLLRTTVFIFFGQAEIDNLKSGSDVRLMNKLQKVVSTYINQIAFLAQSHEEIVRLDISMNETLRVNVFDTGDLKWRKILCRILVPKVICMPGGLSAKKENPGPTSGQKHTQSKDPRLLRDLQNLNPDSLAFPQTFLPHSMPKTRRLAYHLVGEQ